MVKKQKATLETEERGVVIKGLLGEGMKTSLQDIHTILFKIKPQQRPRHDRGGVGGVKIFSLLGLLVGLPAPSPEPLPTLLRAKIEVKVTRPQVTLRLSNSRAI